ncbi:MAG: hypothetical protein ACREVL_03675 [Solimonas sp.]
MRWQSAAITFLAWGACAFAVPGHTQNDSSPDAVLAAIAADARAAGAAPLPPPTTSGLQSQAIEQPESAQAVEVAPRGVCSLKTGGQWQQQPQQTLDQCAKALEHSPEPYDAGGLRHAYWQGTFLSASAKSIYQSRDGREWTKLRDLPSP